jgi:hypothetical protein
MVDRTVNALLLLFGLAAVGVVAVNGLSTLLQPYMPGQFPAFLVLLVLVMALSLIYSHRAFVGGETLRTSRRFTIIFHPLLLDLLVVAAALVIAYLWLVH